MHVSYSAMECKVGDDHNLYVDGSIYAVDNWSCFSRCQLSSTFFFRDVRDYVH